MDKRQKCDSECVLHDAAYSMICFNHGISEDSGNEGVVELDDSLLMEYKEKKRIVVNIIVVCWPKGWLTIMMLKY